jgi:hypothetical protein
MPAMIHLSLRFVAVLSVLLAALLSGCNRGPRIVPVAGQVLIDGKPLTSGYITVLPEASRPATGEIDKTGHFRLTTNEDNDGCAVGTHKVEITAIKMLSPSKTRYFAPKKYESAATSGLTVTIDDPTEELVIKLTWDGGKPFVEDSGSGGADAVP